MTSNETPMLVIYRGEASNWDGIKFPVINLITTGSLAGYTAHFSFYGIEKDFTSSEVATKNLKLTYTADDTKNLPMGMNYAKLTLKETESGYEQSVKIIIAVAPRTIVSFKGLPIAIGAGYMPISS